MENPCKSDISRSWSILIFFLSIGSLHAQSAIDWTLQSDKDGVQLYSATAMCGDKNMLILKFENSNEAVKHVNYNIIIQSEGRNIPSLPQSFELGPSETKVGDCDSSKELITDLKGVDNYQLKVVMVIN